MSQDSGVIEVMTAPWYETGYQCTALGMGLHYYVLPQTKVDNSYNCAFYAVIQSNWYLLCKNNVYLIILFWFQSGVWSTIYLCDVVTLLATAWGVATLKWMSVHLKYWYGKRRKQYAYGSENYLKFGNLLQIIRWVEQKMKEFLYIERLTISPWE